MYQFRFLIIKFSKFSLLCPCDSLPERNVCFWKLFRGFHRCMHTLPGCESRHNQDSCDLDIRLRVRLWIYHGRLQMRG